MAVENKSEQYECPVFGDGYWSCPEKCFNLKDPKDFLVQDPLLRCAILRSGFSDHQDLIELGVQIRQPYNSERFEPIPGNKSLQDFANDGKITK